MVLGGDLSMALGENGVLDDRILPFAVEGLDVRGRVVRLGPMLDRILERHAYPEPVARTLGEAIALTTLLGSSLKFEGRLQLQTRTDGPIDLVVVDFEAPDRVRAYARFDAGAVAAAIEDGAAGTAGLLGQGHLAFTIDQGAEAMRYQGVVALSGQGLEEAAHEYFLRSEQIPTRVRLAVAESFGQGAGTSGHAWRAGGVMVQFLPISPERQRQADLPPGDAPEGHVGHEMAEDDAWLEARSLVETVEDHELIDPTLSSERLLYRLFHERGARVFEPQVVHDQCRCSRERIETMLRQFTAKDRDDMREPDGRITVTCEFCSTRYEFEPAEIDAIAKAASAPPSEN